MRKLKTRGCKRLWQTWTKFLLMFLVIYRINWIHYKEKIKIWENRWSPIKQIKSNCKKMKNRLQNLKINIKVNFKQWKRNWRTYKLKILKLKLNNFSMCSKVKVYKEVDQLELQDYYLLWQMYRIILMNYKHIEPS